MERNEIALAALQAVIWGQADSGSSLLVPVAGPVWVLISNIAPSQAFFSVGVCKVVG